MSRSSWESCVKRCTCVYSRISRRSIGAVWAGGFRNNVPIAKDRCILFTKKVGIAKNLVIMRKEFESRHFSGPNIDYIDEIPIPEPKRQNDDKAAKQEASNQQRRTLWERPSFSSCGWCWAPAMEEKVVQHWGCRPSPGSSDTHSMRLRVLS